MKSDKKHIETSLKWNKENPKRFAEIKKAYKERNPEKHRKWNRIWYLRNKKREDAKKREWVKNNRQKVLDNQRRWHLERKEKLIGEKKPEKCPVCNRSGVRICIDHDHKTGKIRGWLCDGCNVALGRVDDSVIILKGLIKYLNKKR